MATPDRTSVIPYHLANRWVLAVFATIVIAGGVALNWSWLVAVGIAPILLFVLPCLVMCGFGLCAHKLVGHSRTSQPSPRSAPGCCADDTNVAADHHRKH